MEKDWRRVCVNRNLHAKPHPGAVVMILGLPKMILGLPTVANHMRRLDNANQQR